MGILKKLIKAFSSEESWGAMEVESRRWMMQCPCGYEKSVWEHGGIRFGASGNKKTYMRCEQCGRRT